MIFAKLLEVLKVLHKVTASEQDWERTLHHADSGRARWLDVRVLECEWEDELEQGLCDVELERVL